MSDQILRRLRRRVVAVMGVLVLGTLCGLYWWMFYVPRGVPDEKAELPENQPGNNGEPRYDVRQELQKTVEHLSETIGERNTQNFAALKQAAEYLKKRFRESGYSPEVQSYQVGGLSCENIIAEQKGTVAPAEVVIVCAHYDSAVGTPGADDNATGVASLLELARRFAKRKTERTLRLVAFTNEEPPHFQTKAMGSVVYARRCKQNKENIIAVLSLESMGYFSDEKNSQQYPPPLSAFYPSTGNFIGVVANLSSRPLMQRVIKHFRASDELPSEGAALFAALPGVGWSDHWSFWQQGYQGVMITDTATYRNPHYHQPTDRASTLDFTRLRLVVEGVDEAILELVDTNAE